MRLPLPMYKLAKKYFAHHGCWHRLRDPSYPQAQRDECFPPGDVFPKGLRNWSEIGSGEDFLRFHRLMVRNFKWIVQEVPMGCYEYHPWKELPGWLIPILDAMDSSYRTKLAGQLEHLIRGASLDDLGRFIEGPEANDEFPQVHWLVHDLISGYERLIFGPQSAANMGDMAIACFNEHFWGFHGWIDDWYAQWQCNNHETVDQSPLKPHEHSMCEYCRQMKAHVSLLGRWEKYLKVRSQ